MRIKNKSAKSTNGQKILYEIYPIKEVEQGETMPTSTTKDKISQEDEKVNKKRSDASPYFVEKMNKLSEDFKRGFGENKKQEC